MRSAVFILLIFGSVIVSARDQGNSDSCQAEVFVPESLLHDCVVSSPDAQFGVVLNGYREREELGRLAVLQGRKVLARYSLQNLSAGIFVKWSPDSRAFYIMWSQGGAMGDYHVRVFRVSPGSAHEVFPTRLAEAEFAGKHECRTRSTNVFAVKWHGPGSLMIATQVYPTSDCGKEMGIERGYVVRLDDGKIVERYSQDAIEREMDGCPSRTWPTGFWDEKTLQQEKTALKAR